MPGIVQFKTNTDAWLEDVSRYQAAAMISFEAALEAQCRELMARLMKLTPPFSGRQIKKALWGSKIQKLVNKRELAISNNPGDIKKAFEEFAPFRDPEIEDMTARQVGERRVTRDMKKLFFGVPNLTGPRAQGEGGFVFLFEKDGMKYGVPKMFYNPSASEDWMDNIRGKYRTKKGAIQYNVSSQRVSGSWTNIMKYPVQQSLYDSELKRLLLRVGQGKGAWSAGFKAAGGKISERGWVGRHMKAGTAMFKAVNGMVEFRAQNNSAFATDADSRSTVDDAMKGRERDLEFLIKTILEKRWGAGAATFDKDTGRTTI